MIEQFFLFYPILGMANLQHLCLKWHGLLLSVACQPQGLSKAGGNQNGGKGT